MMIFTKSFSALYYIIIKKIIFLKISTNLVESLL